MAKLAVELADTVPPVPVHIARIFDFAAWQASHPNEPLPGDKVNNELDRTDSTVNNVIDRLALIQRDDGGLVAGIVGLDELDPAVLAEIEADMAAAAASAAAAAASASAAGISEGNAEAAKDDAAASEAASAASATNAANSATAADASADAAAQSAADAAATAAVMPPLPSAPNANKALVLNAGGTAYVFKDVILKAVDGIFDTLGVKLRIADPTNANEAATKNYVDGAIAGAGSVPPPVAADNGKVLTAVGDNLFGWFPFLVQQLSDATAFTKNLLVTAGDAAGFRVGIGAAPASQAVPIPASPADDDKVLRANGGLFAWQTPTGQVPVPANPGDNLKALVANLGAYAWTAINTVPTPVAGDANKALVATGAGAYSWQTPPAPADATNAVKGIIRIETAAEVATGTDKLAALTIGEFAASKFNGIGKQTYLLQAGALAPHPSTGPTPSVIAEANGEIYRVLAFADGVTQSAGIAIPLNKKIDVTQAFNVRIRFFGNALGNVLWRIGWSTAGDGENNNGVMSTAQLAAANGVINQNEITAQIACAWNAGAAKEETLFLTVVRIGGDALDTMAAVAYLTTVEIAFITDAGTDA